MKLAFTAVILLLSSIICGIAIDGANCVTPTTVTATWESTGTDHVEVGFDAQKLLITITPPSAEQAGYNLKFSCESDRISFFPADNLNTEIVESQATIHDKVYINNTAGTDRVENVPITITVTEFLTNEQVATITVYATMLPTLGVPTPTPQATQTPPTQPPVIQTGLAVDWTLIAAVIIIVIVVALVVAVLRGRAKKKLPPPPPPT